MSAKNPNKRKIVASSVLLLLIIGTVIFLPLSFVWKQIYIMDVSIKRDALINQVAELNKESNSLAVIAKRLSSSKRIEAIAREGLGLDYPDYKDIIVIRSSAKLEKKSILNEIPLWAVLKKSLSPEDG